MGREHIDVIEQNTLLVSFVFFFLEKEKRKIDKLVTLLSRNRFLCIYGNKRDDTRKSFDMQFLYRCNITR